MPGLVLIQRLSLEESNLFLIAVRNRLSLKLISSLSVYDVTNGVGPCTHLKMILNYVNAAGHVTTTKHTVFNNVDKSLYYNWTLYYMFI